MLNYPAHSLKNNFSWPEFIRIKIFLIYSFTASHHLK